MAHHDHDGDESDHRNAPSNQPQVAALGELGDYEVAEGYPDVRGWAVKLADGRTAGKVHELIVDTGAMRTRYLDVRLDRDLAGAAGERDVLVPIGTARLDGRGDNVLVDNLSAAQLAALPAYEHGSLTRDHEVTVRRHFDAAATGAETPSNGATMGDAAVAGANEGEDFYDHDHFDDRRFFGNRGEKGADDEQRMTLSEEKLAVGTERVSAGEAAVRKTVETRHVEKEVPLTHEEVTVERHELSGDKASNARIGEDEVRVPLTREEAVVQKRVVPTEELVIRKRMVTETKNVEADLRRETIDESDVRGSAGGSGRSGSSDEARGDGRA